MTQTWQTEEDVRAGLEAMGMRGKLSEEDFELSVRDAMRDLELRASTPLVSMRSVMTTTTSTVQTAPPPPRQYRCAHCEDACFVLTAKRQLDAAHVVRANPVPCPKCVPLELRALHAGIDRRFAGARISSMTVRPGNAAAIAYAGTWDGKTSVLISSRDKDGDSKWGTGKTHLASAMLIEQIAKAKPGRFLYVKDFLTGIQALFGGDSGAVQGYVDMVASEPLLVLDDLGAERPTDWAVEQIRTLFDARYRKQLTTVVTTNFVTYEEIAASLGGAVMSRLREYVQVKVGGADMRSPETAR